MRKIARMSVKLRYLRKNLNREPIKYVVQQSHAVPHYLVIGLNLESRRSISLEFIELSDAIRYVTDTRRTKPTCEFIIFDKNKNRFLKFKQ
jgi:hypothetical protein